MQFVGWDATLKHRGGAEGNGSENFRRIGGFLERRRIVRMRKRKRMRMRMRMRRKIFGGGSWWFRGGFLVQAQ
jgi:hypothetical protein